MFPKLLLAVSGAVFLGFGIYSWIDPEKPAEFAGLFIATHDGYAEMAAMYGGFQSSFGLILLLSSFLQGYLRPGLWLLMVCIGTVAIARGSVAISDLDSSFTLASKSMGLDMSSSFTVYTWGALGFEFLLAILAAYFLISGRQR